MLDIAKGAPPRKSFDELLGALSLRLLEVNSQNVGDEIQQLVRDLGEHYHVDRVELRKFDDDRLATTLVHWWTHDNKLAPTSEMSNEQVPWLAHLMLNNQVARICRRSDLPAEAIAGRAIMERDGLQAILAVPLTVNNEIYGAFVLGSEREFEWSDEVIRQVRLLGNAVVYALEHAHIYDSLVTSDARFRAVLDVQSELSLSWLPDGTRTWVNDRYCEFHEQPRELLVGTSFVPHLAPAHSQIVLANIKTMTPDSPMRTDEHQVVLPSGKSRWLSWIDRGVFDDSGKLIEILSVGRDVTDRKLAEELLIVSENRYRNLVESTADWIWERNLNCEYTYSNHHLESILGYTADELGKNSIRHLLHPDDLLSVEERLPDVTKKKIGWSDWVLRLRHKDGSYRYLQSNANPVFDVAGQLCGFRGIDRDVTDAKLAQQGSSRRLQFQKDLAELSTSLLTSSIEDTRQRIEDALHRIGMQYELFGIGIWWFSGNRGEVVELFTRWRRKQDVWPDPGVYDPHTAVPWFAGRMVRGEITQVNDVSELAEKAHTDHKTFSKWGMYSVLGFPAPVEQRIASSCCVITASEPRAWEEEVVHELRLIAETITGACVRHWATVEIAHRSKFQRRLANLSTSLLTSPIENTHDRVKEALGRIGSRYDCYSIGVWLFPTDDRSSTFRFAGWQSDRHTRQLPSGPVASFDVPWTTSKMLRGQLVRIDDVSKMPDEARIDQATFQSFGAKSLLGIPGQLGDNVIGSCIFNSNEQRNWGEETILELQLLGNAIVGACARRLNSDEVHRHKTDLVRSQDVGRLGNFSLTIDDTSQGFPPSGKLQVSSQFCELFDINAEEASFELVASRIHPDDRQRIFEKIEEGMRTASAFREIYRVVRTDGFVIDVEDRTIYEADEEGRTCRIFGTVQDVTDQVASKNKIKQALAEIEKLKDRLQEENVYLREEVRAAHGFTKIIGTSPKLQSALTAVSKVAPTDVSVMIHGETGTGKELIAQAIHDLSNRRESILVSVNCAVLSKELIDSELFGHEKGSFTGAHNRRKGRFELASGGTLFLDEIGELPGELQAKLLRVLQTGEFERVGGSQTLRVDVRLIVATNRNLRQSVDEGTFRADLYYRISNFPIELPPLRERKEDIPALTEFIARKHAKLMGKDIQSISARTLRYVSSQDWPGNVRELEGFIQRALISADGSVLDYADAPDPGPQSIIAPVPVRGSADLKNAKREHILSVLEQTEWVIGGDRGAATMMGVPASTLRSMMKRLGIRRPG